MNKRTALIFYVLSVYVVVQFIWWGYHLIELTEVVSQSSKPVSNRIAMIIGEGAVFLLLLLIGIWQIRRSIRKELKLSERQNNFLLSVTHELKTPLAANKLYLQTIKKRELSREQTEELLKKAIDENVRLERMIDNILNATRLENNRMILEKESIDLGQFITTIQERYNSLLEKAVIEIDVDTKIELFADRFMLETIFNNLIENALKYAGTDLPITLYCSKKMATIEFGVKDHGPGVPKELKPEIFKKFFRVGNEEVRTQKGTGLGLFIVSQLVKMHNGTITCEDNLPSGLNFRITFNHGK
ncbi:MAG: HAMP domain-containing histidine kinase [Crocinitomicaceae bacterium]|jgi:two-component system, OmpR family, phosphate regulon sensor histidine kinase PhoR|nr:HAMP domain-containing histidine kinase [Crocinitomicaceae bacterium]